LGTNHWTLFEKLSFYSSEDVGVLGCDTMWTQRQIPMFKRETAQKNSTDTILYWLNYVTKIQYTYAKIALYLHYIYYQITIQANNFTHKFHTQSSLSTC
jgi:hypothetical protein